MSFRRGAGGHPQAVNAKPDPTLLDRSRKKVDEARDAATELENEQVLDVPPEEDDEPKLPN
ncbi:hypothetical protein [Actinokineospora cianjurensis]|uniref:Uncharacterized protein n=1 Tax=Actinokineospora cianjurensis TaxID=585224 RepID=A0A421B629_9PSEU|nr:hypothetical protein [Actinokineospora cianjurensis]RLK59718.1 hypothetical protein CLV68_0202 [Actinokineospora cianjurensis]